MTRPVRIEFEGALYHVTSRGDRREAIYEDDSDRTRFLEILGEVIRRFNWVCHSYCQMTNHYHVVIATPDGNLSKGMRQLNGVYTQTSNRRHGRVGHLGDHPTGWPRMGCWRSSRPNEHRRYGATYSSLRRGLGQSRSGGLSIVRYALVAMCSWSGCRPNGKGYRRPSAFHGHRHVPPLGRFRN